MEEEANKVANFSYTRSRSEYNTEIAFYESHSMLKVKLKYFHFSSLFALLLPEH